MNLYIYFQFLTTLHEHVYPLVKHVSVKTKNKYREQLDALEFVISQINLAVSPQMTYVMKDLSDIAHGGSRGEVKEISDFMLECAGVSIDNIPYNENRIDKDGMTVMRPGNSWYKQLEKKGLSKTLFMLLEHAFNMGLGKNNTGSRGKDAIRLCFGFGQVQQYSEYYGGTAIQYPATHKPGN